MKLARRSALRLAIVAASTAILAACGEEILVRTDSRVYAEGGIARRIEISGKESDGSLPDAPEWLESTAGVRLARPEAWTRVDAAPGRLAAEGFFPSGADVVPTLSHPGGGEPTADRVSVAVAREDLVVATRWFWRETLADPYGAADDGAAIDTLIALACKALREELQRTFGPAVNAAPAERFFRNDARKLIHDLLPSIRTELARAGAATGVAKDDWRKVLARYGVPAAGEDQELFSEAQIEAALEWSRARVARALSTRQRALAPGELIFWPMGDEAVERAEAIVNDVWGSPEALQAEAGPALEALGGYYGRASSPRFRFEARLRMPGRLLRTNGAPEAEGVVWSLSDELLVTKELEMLAESVELSPEPLRALGARRELDAAGLLQLVDLLSGRDSSPELLRLLRSAVDAGSLAVLRDEQRVADELEPLARALADLLDPAVTAAAWAP